MAWKVCWQENSLHEAVMTQMLELDITTTLYTNQDKCNDKLQIWDMLSNYGKYCEYEPHTPTGSGDMNKGTK